MAEKKVQTIAEAFIAAQSEFKPVGKSSQGYGYRYADLAAVTEMAYPVLHRHGLAVMQSFDNALDEGYIVIKTTLVHASGDNIGSSLAVPLPDKVDAQKLGAAITYGRRYALGALLGIVTEEDTDASELKDQPRTTKPRQKTDNGYADPTIAERVKAIRLCIKDTDPTIDTLGKANALLAEITNHEVEHFNQITTAARVSLVEDAVGKWMNQMADAEAAATEKANA